MCENQSIGLRQIASQPPIRICALAPNVRRLVYLMQETYFGTIEELYVAGGQPVFDPFPSVIKEYKFGGESKQRLEKKPIDFVLKSEVLEFLHEVRQLGECVISRLEIRYGLPFRMYVKQACAP